MSDDGNVIAMPPQKDGSEDLLIGPFEQWRVQVDGRVIPRLTGWREGDLIWLCVDNRFAQGFPKQYVLGAAALIAQALAIGSGYAWLGAENKDQPFAPIGCAVGSLNEVPKP